MADNFGERAATTAEIAAWVTLVNAGRSGMQAYKVKADAQRDRDSMRPTYGSGQASHEAEE